MNRWQAKRVANQLNGSTLLGLAVARASGARLSRGPRGLIFACRVRRRMAWAPVWTIGNVVLTPHREDWLHDRPRLVRHEERHSWQYAACLGLPMLPMYGVAALCSYVRTGDPGVRNAFERLAGLADGGYPELSRRRVRRG